MKSLRAQLKKIHAAMAFANVERIDQLESLFESRLEGAPAAPPARARRESARIIELRAFAEAAASSGRRRTAPSAAGHSKGEIRTADFRARLNTAGQH